jgi:molybdenum cofactor cytidylyltransferase
MTADESSKIGGLLLAAGGSSRLGQPKQLIEFRGKTLLRRAAETLVDSGCDPVLVILGAEFERSQAEVGDLPLKICVNPEWQTGMSSSLTAGLRSIIELEPELTAVVVTLCDQPYISTEDIDSLISEYRQTRTSATAAEYSGRMGVPALFPRELFGELLSLKGDKGARHILRGLENVTAVKMPRAAFDIDTPDDLLEIV